jgi:hypothetical protein
MKHDKNLILYLKTVTNISCGWKTRYLLNVVILNHDIG